MKWLSDVFRLRDPTCTIEARPLYSIHERKKEQAYLRTGEMAYYWISVKSRDIQVYAKTRGTYDYTQMYG